MTRKQKRLLFRIIIAAVLFAAGSLLPLGPTVEMGVFLVCYAVIGWDIVWKAVTNILHGQVFDENFLMTIATIGALILGEHSEGVAVMLFSHLIEQHNGYTLGVLPPDQCANRCNRHKKVFVKYLPLQNVGDSFPDNIPANHPIANQ